MNTEEKYNQLKQNLKSLGKVLIAYSGGVDSTFLLKAAVEAIGADNVLACIAVGPSLPKSQLDQAIEIAESIGSPLRQIEATEMHDPAFLDNAPDRCFHCKSNLFKVLNQIAETEGYNACLYGCNFDDKSDYRPGHKAAKAFNITGPLMDAELTKQEIRTLSRQLNLPTAEMPASPCLASRVPYGQKINAEKLNQIEHAEEFLKELGFPEIRVRHHSHTARIEVPQEIIQTIATDPIRSQIVKKLKSLGFKYISLDLQGFRSGALNETLSDDEKQKNV